MLHYIFTGMVIGAGCSKVTTKTEKVASCSNKLWTVEFLVSSVKNLGITLDSNPQKRMEE